MAVSPTGRLGFALHRVGHITGHLFTAHSSHTSAITDTQLPEPHLFLQRLLYTYTTFPHRPFLGRSPNLPPALFP